MKGLVLLSLCGAAASLKLRSEEWQTLKPVAKVVELLQGMSKQLETEGKADEAAYKKMQCWCNTNLKEKTQAVSDGQARIKTLESKVAEFTAANTRLTLELQTGAEEVSANKNSLAQAQALRDKQSAQFRAEEKDLLSSIAALQKAQAVITNKNATALIQGGGDEWKEVVKTLQKELKQHSKMLESALKPSDMNMLQAALAQAPRDARVGEIVGVLKAMQETFQNNLKSAREAEASSQKNFVELKAAKDKELEAGQSQLSSKRDQAANLNMKVAETKQELADTQKNLGNDSTFLATVQAKCAQADKEWEVRRGARGDEVAVLAQTISILTSDAARDTFSKVSKVSLLQLRAVEGEDQRQKASAVLLTASHKLHAPQLALLSSKVNADSLDNVKKAIDDMVTALLNQQKDEASKKDYCLEEFRKAASSTAEKEHSKTNLAARTQELANAMEGAKGAIAAIQKQSKELKVQLQKAAEERTKATKDFELVVADQREMQKVLKEAIQTLSKFYNSPAAATPSALLQSGKEDPPARLPEYRKKGGAAGVIVLLEHILQDSARLEAAAIKSEGDAKVAYSAFVQATNAAVETRAREVTDKAAVKAKAELELVQTQESQKGVADELTQAAAYVAQLHLTCDPVTQKFSARQTSRDEEVAALREAKAVLSGAKITAF